MDFGKILEKRWILLCFQKKLRKDYNMTYFIMIIISLLLLQRYPRTSKAEIEKGKAKIIREHYKIRFVLKKQKIKNFFSFFVIFAVSAFRYGVGTDYFYTYVPAYIILRDRRYTYNYYEKGFEWINRLCIVLSDNYQMIFIVTSLAIYGILFWIIMKYSENPKMSLFVYFFSSMYFNSLSNVRQAMAMIICLLSSELYINWKGSKKKKIILFCLLIILACFIHSTAFLFSVIPFLSVVKNIRIKNHILIAGILTIIAIVLNYIGIISEMLDFVLVYLQRYQRYSSSGTIYWSYLVFNIIIYLMMYVASKNSEIGAIKDNKGILYLNIQFLAVMLLVFSSILPTCDRLSRYFMICQCLSVPYFIECIKNVKTKKTIILGFVVIYVLWILFYIFSYGADGCFPYHNVFFVDQMWQKGYFGH